MRHLLVTNDFPPKVGGIQNMLYELWRRLPADEVTVLTTRFEGSEVFDRGQAFRIERSSSAVLWPTPALAAEVRRLATATESRLVVLDPALPVGLVGPRLGLAYAVFLHGAEVTVPGRLPVSRGLLRSVIEPASLVIAAGGYPAAEAVRAVGARRSMPPVVVVPPGVDVERFHPLDPAEVPAVRKRLGLPAEGRLVVSVSRLVPRKGMDVLIEAVALLAPAMPDLILAIGGSGRERPRLERTAQRRAPAGVVRFLGRVSDDDLPALDGAADVWAMVCRNRWAGLEQEGFGIVFLEAAAAGVPQLAGRSGGAHEAVVDGETGYVIDRPADPVAVAAGLRRLLEAPPEERRRLGEAGRQRAVSEFDYDVVAARLGEALDEAVTKAGA